MKNINRQHLDSFLKKIFVIIYWFFLPIRVYLLRRKRIIKVVFILSDLGKWKSEPLYHAMIRHDRFMPSLLVAPYANRENCGLHTLVDYLDKKGYKYHVLHIGQKISEYIKPDIIFYQEPYRTIFDKKIIYIHNLSSLFCYVSYGFHWINNNWIINPLFKNLCWQLYFENEIAIKGISTLMTNKGVNCIVTGLPMTESFLQPISCYKNPWKSGGKLRIIWAPHHTVLHESVICYSTFIKYCDYMLELAKKYKDSIQIAFKPHPLLLTKLYQLWGKEKTDNYYSLWANGENTQLVLGEYVSLFMHSDAMIHDCGTFTVEYHYTKKPVLYLLNGEDHYKDLNEFGRIAFDLHYKSSCETDIETFIENVIHGKDDMKEMREKFYNDYLLPPNGMSASDNIIKAILG